jgi:hypothetical protein
MSTLHKGLTTKSPSATDKSTQPPTSRSVNDGATRGGTAASPRSLGPREKGM